MTMLLWRHVLVACLSTRAWMTSPDWTMIGGTRFTVCSWATMCLHLHLTLEVLSGISGSPYIIHDSAKSTSVAISITRTQAL